MSLIGTIKEKLKRRIWRHKSVAQKYQEFDCLLETEDCAIFRNPQESASTIVVSFTGVGHAMGGVDVQSPEFFGTSGLGEVLFVVDKNRTWGNALDIHRIAETIKKHANGRPIFCIGNSMGGFLAILFSIPLEARRVLAFSPQYSIDPAVVPQETRWQKYRTGIETIYHSDLGKSWSNNCDYLAVFGDDTREDIHFPFFKSSTKCQTLRINDAGHDVARHLKSRAALYDVINGWFSDEEFTHKLKNKAIQFEV